MQQNRSSNAVSSGLISAKYFPIRVEPIRHSGEWLTIGVGVISEDGKSKIISTLTGDLVQSLYRDRLAPLVDIANIALDELREQLDEAPYFQIEEFEFSLSGVELGEVRQIREKSIEAMLNIAIISTSSLARITDDNETLHEARQPKLKESVIEIIKGARPSLAKNFNRPLKHNKTTITIGYVGNKIATNFYDIGVNIPYSLSACDRMLMDMQAFLHYSTLGFKPAEWSGLIIQKPDMTIRENNSFDRLADRLFMHADALGLRIETVKEPQEAAGIILDDAK